MADQWQNRITGEIVLTPPDDQPLGLWLDRRNQPWVGTGSDGLGVSDDVLPHPVYSGSVVRVSDRLNEVEADTWKSWCASLPVDLQLGEAPALRNEERLLLEALPHYERICRSPRAHLTIEEIREPVGRARRFPPRAVNVLASHSEDWHSRSFRSVKPKRVLSEVKDDDYAIYENRALSTLRLRLVATLALRLKSLRDLESAIRHFNQGDTSKGRRFRLERLCDLLFEIFDDPPDLKMLEALIGRLSSAQGRLLALESTFLFKAIKGTAKVSNPLLSTNILRDDDHYRHVMRVWRAWETRQKDKITRRETLTSLCIAMDRFTALLCVRAIALLPLAPTNPSSAPFGAGAEHVELRFGWNLRWKDDGTLQLSKAGLGVLLRIVGVPFQIDKMPASSANQLLRSLKPQESGEPPLLLVSLGRQEDLHEDWAEENGAKRGGAGHSSQPLPEVHHAVVSPTNLDSIETVARIIRSFVAKADWPVLPLKMELDQHFNDLFPDLSRTIRSNWGAPPSSEICSELKTRLKDLQKTKTAKEQELEKLQQAERSHRGNRSKGPRINYNAEKHRVREEIAEVETRKATLEETSSVVKSIVEKFVPALACPCCGHPTTLPPEGSAFSCSSDSCKTRWGRIHDERGNLQLFLYPDGTNPDSLSDPVRALGADYLKQ